MVKYANDCFSKTYCYIEVVFLGSAKFRWNRERERRGLNHVLIWFAEVTCLSDRGWGGVGGGGLGKWSCNEPHPGPGKLWYICTIKW